jgi:hypothetical protein
VIIRKLRRRKGLRNFFVKLPRSAAEVLGSRVSVEDRGDHIVVRPGGETPLRWGGFLEVSARVAERWGTRYVVVDVGSGSVTVRPASGEDLARLRPPPSPASIVRELSGGPEVPSPEGGAGRGGGEGGGAVIRRVYASEGDSSFSIYLPRSAVSMLGTLLVTVEDRGDHLVVKPATPEAAKRGARIYRVSAKRGSKGGTMYRLTLPAGVVRRWGVRFVSVEERGDHLVVRPVTDDDLRATALLSMLDVLRRWVGEVA